MVLLRYGSTFYGMLVCLLVGLSLVQTLYFVFWLAAGLEVSTAGPYPRLVAITLGPTSVVLLLLINWTLAADQWQLLLAAHPVFVALSWIICWVMRNNNTQSELSGFTSDYWTAWLIMTCISAVQFPLCACVALAMRSHYGSAADTVQLHESSSLSCDASLKLSSSAKCMP